MTIGRFITFEGGEGMGKSTQARLLVAALEAQGHTVELTREPGGTPGAEVIRELLLAPPDGGWEIEAEAMLFAAARADHVARRVRPAIEAGRWVVCDRFIDSSRAYQAMAGGLGDEAVRQLHQVGSGGLLPDLTIVLDCPANDVAARLLDRDGDTSDAIGGRAQDYHSAVNQAFIDFAAAEPDRFVVIDGNAPVADVHQQVMRTVETLLQSSQ